MLLGFMLGRLQAYSAETHSQNASRWQTGCRYAVGIVHAGRHAWHAWESLQDTQMQQFACEMFVS